MVGWHHRLYGHEFEQTPGDGEGMGTLTCYSPWDPKEFDTEQQKGKDNWQTREVTQEGSVLRKKL